MPTLNPLPLPLPLPLPGISILLLFFLFFTQSLHSEKVWDKWVKDQGPVWVYGQGNYSLLGFNPAVDAFLTDPFFMPRFATDATAQLNTRFDLAMKHAWGFSGFGHTHIPTCQQVTTAPPEWLLTLKDAAIPAYTSWKCFLDIRKEVISILSALTDDEKEFIRNNYATFFFGNSKDETYDFFTTESILPFLFYNLSRKVDLGALATQEQRLAKIAQYLYDIKNKFDGLPGNLHFTWEEEGAKLLISGTDNDIHKEDVDFLIDIGGDDIYLNNAGGTKGVFPVALAVDFSGNDTYIGDEGVQGAGLLGIGLLADFAGNDSYTANRMAQGAAFFGSGALWDQSGDDNYKIHWFGQAAAVFGTAMLYDASGNDRYQADGMAQAASSTGGAAWLIDLGGDDVYRLGNPNDKGWHSGMGIGQGGAAGVRTYPWINSPSLYGGLAVLYDAGGNDKYYGAWFSQGSAYFMGAGILVNKGGKSSFEATVDSQGQGLHLAAGLLLDEGGDNSFRADWGSQGTAGDLSTGILIDPKGNNTYISREHSLATSRKPFALGVVYEEGNNTNIYGKTSLTHIAPPLMPLERSKALFIHAEDKENWLSPLPLAPRGLLIPYDSRRGFLVKGSVDKLDQIINPKVLINSLVNHGYVDSRKKLEALDNFRFSHASTNPDVKEISNALLQPIQKPSDYDPSVVLYALQYYYNTRDNIALNDVENGLKNNSFQGGWVRQMALKYVDSLDESNALTLAKKLSSPSEGLFVQVTAAWIVAKNANETLLPKIKQLLWSRHEAVRYATLKGLEESKQKELTPYLIPLVKHLLNDKSPLVKNEATDLLKQLR